MTPRRVRLVLLVVPAMWGLVFVGVDQVLEELDAFELVAIRFALISVLFGLLMLVRPELRPSFARREWLLIGLSGLMAVPLSQLGIVYAQNWLAPSLASLIITTAPAMAAILAPLFLPETVTLRQAAGFVMAVAGAAVVIVVGAGGIGLEDSNLWGAAVGMITPVAWALYTILLKRLSAGSPLTTVGTGLMVGTIFMIPWMPRALEAAGEIEASTWGWLLYLAFGGTFVSYIIWFWSLRHLDAAQTSAYLYLVPVSALVWSLLILGDVPPAGALAGGALVFAGVALTQTRAQTTQLPVEP